MSQRAQRNFRNQSGNWSQRSIEESFAEEPSNIDEIVNNLVRYIVYKAGEHMNIGKTELVKNVIGKSNIKFEDVMNRVKTVLKKTYGYNLLTVETTKGKDKVFIVSNALPYINDSADDKDDYPEDSDKIVLLLVLTHIFMMNNSVLEVSLFEFLKKFGIDVESKHAIFGNVKDYIMKTLVKKHYLNATVDPITKKYTFSWGPRSEKEISKHSILEFVCKVYKRQPKDWIKQFEMASEQDFKNTPETPNVEND